MNPKYTLQTAKEEAQRCLLCEDPPCATGCPAGVNPRRFIRKLRNDNIKGAIRELRSSNVMAASCAYICPSDETCMKSCTAKGLSRPIDIRGLQRFLMDFESQSVRVEPKTFKKLHNEKVAVIGAGPCGLSCAAHLASMGYEVDLFEKEEFAGGMLSSVIPEFRLPKEVIGWDLDFVKKLGVTIKLENRVHDPRDLIKGGYGAVFVSSGLHGTKDIDISGSKKKGVYSAIDFLRAHKTQEITKLNGRVVVIGGGDSAIDCARAAKSLGNETFVLYRRVQTKMPASNEDVDTAMRENVEFYFRFLPLKILGDDTVVGIRGVRIAWKDDNKYDTDGDPFDIKCKTVIFAVGLAKEDDFNLCCSEDKFSTSEEGIFAGGDFVYGASTAVKAVGSGKNAAVEIDKYLSCHSSA